MCSADPDPNAAYKLKRNRHILLNTKLCEICQVISKLDSTVLQTWNTILSKVRNVNIIYLINLSIYIRMKIN